MSIPYLDALEDLPPDLLNEALNHVVQNYPYKFPKPASVREPVKAKLAERHAAVTRLEGILKTGTFEEPRRAPRTPEQIAEVERMCEEVRQKLAGVGA